MLTEAASGYVELAYAIANGLTYAQAHGTAPAIGADPATDPAPAILV